MQASTEVTLAASLTANGNQTIALAASLWLPPEHFAVPHPGLIVGHGAGSCRANHQEFCEAACAKGFAVLAFDFRGHGESEGRSDGPLEEDVLAAVRYLGSLPAIVANRLCYRGSSMGGFYGLKAATIAEFAALALLCPASEDVVLSLTEEAEDSPSWDIQGLRAYFQRQDSRELARQVRCPTLLVHARNDDVVPFQRSLVLSEHLAGETTLVALPAGGHTGPQHDPRIHSLTVDWLLSRLEGC